MGLLTETSSPAISCKSCQFQQNTHTKNTKEPASANFICKSSCFILLCRMKDKYQTCVICDFGLSKSYENSVMKTHCGTTNYMYLFVCFSNNKASNINYLFLFLFLIVQGTRDSNEQLGIHISCGYLGTWVLFLRITATAIKICKFILYFLV